MKTFSLFLLLKWEINERNLFLEIFISQRFAYSMKALIFFTLILFVQILEYFRKGCNDREPFRTFWNNLEHFETFSN